MATTAAAKTPRIQLVLNLQAEHAATERVKRVTKGAGGGGARQRAMRPPPQQNASQLGPHPALVLRHQAGHEVVEVNGFTFKRRRAAAEENAVPNVAAAAARDSRHEADQHEVTSQLYRRLTSACRSLGEQAPPAELLLAYASSVCGAEVDRAATNAALAVSLADVFQGFQLALASELRRGSVRVAAHGAAQASGEVSQLDQQHCAVDLDARKAGLRARLASFEREEAEWQALLLKAEELDSQLAAECTSAGGGAAAVPQDCSAPDSLLGLERSQRELHRRLAMQVEGLCKLVGDVEELVDGANRSAQATQVRARLPSRRAHLRWAFRRGGGAQLSARAMAAPLFPFPLLHQAEYHKEKFRVFPHVDSPARLIRELVKPVPRRQQQPHQEDAAEPQTLA